MPHLGSSMPLTMPISFGLVGIAAAGVAGAFTVTTAQPKRISARLELTLEDIAAVGQVNF